MSRIEPSSFYRVAEKSGPGLGLSTFMYWGNGLRYPGNFVKKSTMNVKIVEFFPGEGECDLESEANIHVGRP